MAQADIAPENPAALLADADPEQIAAGLNRQQRAVVTAQPGNLLIVAGAGTGKTRVLVHRIAWLITTGRAVPGEILAVTFTNKAANEMKSRIANLIGHTSKDLWVGTFHGICHRLLRMHASDVGLDKNFEVMDAGDQVRLVKRVLGELDLSPIVNSPRGIAGYINAQKEKGLRPADCKSSSNSQIAEWTKVYDRYEAICTELNLVDFSELLLRCHEMWLNHDDLLARYKHRFRHILVDELQDTNQIQFAWLRLLGQERSEELRVAPAHVLGVGDDDQSIYGWRGARPENLQDFCKFFPGTVVLRLEQNYRSTATILRAANHLIARNSQRMGKNLRTDSDAGEPITIYSAQDEFDEARFVCQRVREWVQPCGDERLEDVAVLYRTNAQSRVLEQVFQEGRIPYRIWGGQRFFDRAEIRNALAYMRLILDVHADQAFQRIINVPSRTIGGRTVDRIRAEASSHSCSMWTASIRLAQSGGLPRAEQAIKRFVDQIRSCRDRARTMSLPEIAAMCVMDLGLMAWHTREQGETAEARKENLEELLVAAEQFQKGRAGEADPAEARGSSSGALMREFLDEVALQGGEHQTGQDARANLMTLHSAKGLEFPLVFIVGLEDGLLPLHSSDSRDGLEERRLMYVGITRCKSTLFLTHAATRTRFGRSAQRQRPSEYLRQIPSQLVRHARHVVESPRVFPRFGKRRPSANGRTGPSAGNARERSRPGEASVGQRIKHQRFGEGVVSKVQGTGVRQRMEVDFVLSGKKWLMSGNEHLKPLE